MTQRFEIPGEDPLEIDRLVLDVNGTLTDRGKILPGVGGRIRRLRRDFEIYLFSADTFGTLAILARTLHVHGRQVSSGAEKRDLIGRLDPSRCAAVGNGRNDALMFAEARLAIAVVGPEGLSGVALTAADVVCRSIESGLDLLSDPKALAATLRP